MRILLLTMYFTPDLTSANAVIMTELAEQLQALGHEVTAVTSCPHYAENKIAVGYRGKLIQREYYKGIKIIRTYLYTNPNKESLLSRLLNYVTFNTLSTLAALFSGDYDIVLAPSPPLTIGLSAWLVGLFKDIPFVYNVQDIYPDIAIKLGVLQSPRLIRLFRWMEDFVYRKAIAVTVLSEGFKQNLLLKGVPTEKLIIIPNFVDTTFIKPGCKDNKFAKSHDLSTKFVVLYAGNVGLSQGLEHFVQTASHLQDLPNIKLLIIGNGTAKTKLEALVQEQSLDNVMFLPFQPREQLPALYAAADICLVSLRVDVGDESVPSKAYTILASGRPLLAAVHKDSETKRLIDAANCGMWVPPEDTASLAATIRAIHKLADDERQKLGMNGRIYVEQHYTPKSVAQQYETLFERLMTKNLKSAGKRDREC